MSSQSFENGAGVLQALGAGLGAGLGEGAAAAESAGAAAAESAGPGAGAAAGSGAAAGAGAGAAAGAMVAGALAGASTRDLAPPAGLPTGVKMELRPSVLVAVGDLKLSAAPAPATVDFCCLLKKLASVGDAMPGGGWR